MWCGSDYSDMKRAEMKGEQGCVVNREDGGGWTCTEHLIFPAEKGDGLYED